ncbi:FMRFamide receptor-like [Brachionus plicatilis]|uniref:FMRFamide receptor-like n=1 Tax=Brachionus plicatilis TaxID=10195 RepID=A0A3M7PHY6_BRAPC|nr:FMRFamide receptor-like [Brachionus plicatilis]
MNSTNNIENFTKNLGYRYLIPFVCTFGIFCNIINLIVLASPRLKESPYIYLIFLALSDLLTLAFTLTLSFTRGFYFQDIDIQYILQKLEKKIFIPTANVFSAFSVVITVALTVERYFYIKFPMHASNFYTSQYAKRISLILFILIAIFRLPMYFFTDVKKIYPNESQTVTSHLNYNYQLVRNLEEFQQAYFFTSFLLFEIIPFFLLSTLNFNLVLLVKKSNKQVYRNSNLEPLYRKDEPKTLSSIESDYPTGLSVSRTNVKKLSFINYSSVRRRKEIKLTRTLISVVFLLLFSEISSIITYDKFTEFLVKSYYPDYMKTYHKLQLQQAGLRRRLTDEAIYGSSFTMFIENRLYGCLGHLERRRCCCPSYSFHVFS